VLRHHAQESDRSYDEPTSGRGRSSTRKVQGGIISQAYRYFGGVCSSQSIFPPHIIQVLLVRYGAVGLQPRWRMRCGRRSPRYTTRCQELVIVRC